MKTMENRIEKIRVIRKIDSDPDTSHLGTFDNEAETKFAINHHERGGDTRRSYQWFNSSSVDTSNSDAENKKYAEQDYKRIVSLDSQAWYFMGIVAEATVYIAGVRQTLQSGGLWGIESDSEESYLKDIEIEQLSELRDILKEIGFKDEDIVTYEKIERTEE